MQKFSLKRLTAWMLTMVMIIGIVPANVQADVVDDVVSDIMAYHLSQGDAMSALGAGLSASTYGLNDKEEVDEDNNDVTVYTDSTVVDAAIFFSDLHTNKSDDKEDELKGVLNSIESGNNGVGFTSVTSCGDAFSMNDSTYEDANTRTITKYIHSVFPNADVNYVWSDHDRKVYVEDNGMLDKNSGFVYGAGEDGILGTDDDGNYYIYELSMADLSTNDRYKAGFHNNDEVTAAIAQFTADAKTLHSDRPLFIASHQPLFDRRNDNGHALEWCTAINAVAEEMDVAFFHGHNHKYDVDGDYYYAKGSVMPVCKRDYSSQDVVLNFTHMCAGYLAPSSTWSVSDTTREGTAVAVTIYEDEITYTTYNKDGVYGADKTYGLDVTVPRDHAAKTMTAFDDTEQISVQATAAGLSSITVTNVCGDIDSLDNVYDDYMAVDVVLTGVKEGTAVRYSMQVRDVIRDNDLVLYHVNGTALTPIEYEMTVSESGGRYLDFTTDLTGVFAYGILPIPEGYTASYIDISNVVKNEYFVGEDLDRFSPVVKATYTMEGCPDITRVLYIEEDDFTVSGFDMTTAGAQTVTVSYGELKAYFIIHVWEKEFTASGSKNVTVDLGGGEFGVEKVNIVTVDKGNVEEAFAGILDSDTLAAYDIDLTYAIGYYPTDTVKKVTLPIPAGVENPAVFYISDDLSTIEMMPCKDNGNGTVTFETTHFSTFVVGDNGTIEVTAPQTQTRSESIITTKKGYVLSDELSGDVLIANSKSEGTAYLLTKNGTKVDATLVTVKFEGADTYIEESEVTDASIWAVSTSSLAYNFKNGDYYLYSDDRALSLKSNNNTRPWKYSNNKLYYDTTRDRYLQYSNGWTQTKTLTSASNIYFYKSGEVSTTLPAGTFSIAGNSDVITKAVENGTTVTLGSTLTFVPENGNPTYTENPDGVIYAVVQGGYPNDIISGINGNTVTFSGNAGWALVKVSYTSAFGEVTNYIQINAKQSVYTLSIKNGDKTVSGTTVAKKQVKNGDTMQLTAVVEYETADGKGTVQNHEVTWAIPVEYQHIATVTPAGLITFTGDEGAFYVTCSYGDAGSEAHAVAGVNISVSAGSYSTPTDGTNDFPEYPNPGAIRFDKTATPIGNFAETGMVQMELSMTGIPYATSQRLDVVLMLDHSNSMTETRMEATRAAAKLFVENIVMNEDDTFNNNRVYVASFAGGNPQYAGESRHDFRIYKMTENEEDGYQIINDQNELDALFDSIDNMYYKFSSNSAPYGTEYDQSLEDCYNILNASKLDDNKQFCVFMSDGIPNVYRYGDGDNDKTTSSSAMANMFTGTNYDTRDNDYKYEYWSTLMKQNGVTVFTVGLGLHGTNSSLSGATATQCENVSNILLNDISGPAGETTADRDTGTTISKKDTYFFSVADSNAADDMKNVFANIAGKILEAATDVVVTDKVSGDFAMVFDIPQGTRNISGDVPAGQEFYIEVVNYKLFNPKTDSEIEDAATYEAHDRVGEPAQLCRVYLKETDEGTYSAAKNASGTPFETVTFAAAAQDEKAYWDIVTDDNYVAQDDEIVITVNETKYKFIENGNGKFKITSGAYAFGNINEDTNISDDLVIVTPYFAYSAHTKMLAWTVDRLVEFEEIALRYILYLEGSSTEIGKAGETEAGTYFTNDWAYLTYTNHLGNDCRQEFPRPQITWNGAQVSYVFYLVNAAGQPINKSGQVVDFANASFITDVYTTSVVWNKQGNTSQGTGSLSAEWLAVELLPSEYTIYDMDAGYLLTVYEDESATDKGSEFTISGSQSEAIKASLMERLSLSVLNTVSTSTTKVYNTKAGTKYTAYKTYYSTDADMRGFDFANTTVAFAVVWQPRLVEDTVVIDYGADVLIDVVRNDFMQNTINGIDINAPSGVLLNTGLSSYSRFKKEPLSIDGNNISVEGDNFIRFKQSDMEFSRPVTFYYETAVKYYEDSDESNGFMYSKVTVIPATTIYYEESFVQFKDTSADGKGDYVPFSALEKRTSAEVGQWSITGNVDKSSTQDQDRPGESQISIAIDHDNVYGYDGINNSSTTYSLGSAAMVVSTSDMNEMNIAPQAKFTFTGTGFDIISATDSTSGAIYVKVTDSDGEPVASKMVINYYGYEFKTTENVPVKIAQTSDGLKKTAVRAFYSAKYYDVYTDGTDKYIIIEDDEIPVQSDGTVPVTTEEWKVTDSGDSHPWQVPVLKFTWKDLVGENANSTIADAYDTYTVTIYIEYEKWFDMTRDDGQYTFVLDSIRIYDPAGVTNDQLGDIKDAYIEDGEYNPRYVNIRDRLVAKGALDNEQAFSENGSIKGAVFIDGKTNTSNISDYENPGPNNETYLAGGQGVSFKIQTPFNPENAHLGVKLSFTTAENAKGNLRIKVGNNEERTIELGTSTDMYYDLEISADEWQNNDGEWISPVIILANSGSGTSTVISLTNIKVTEQLVDTNDSMSPYALNRSVEREIELIVDEDTLETVATTYKALISPVFEPDFFEFTFTGNKHKRYMVVITSNDVNELTVDGEAMTNLTKEGMTQIIINSARGFANKLGIDIKSDDYYVWRKQVDDAALEYSVAAADEDGIKSNTMLLDKDGNKIIVNSGVQYQAYSMNDMDVQAIMAELAERVFEPEYLKSEITRRLDGRLEAVVTASEDVEYVIIDGAIVNRWITETVIDLETEETSVRRVFVAAVADENAEITAYSAEGIASFAADGE